jgi:hypothetical protein
MILLMKKSMNASTMLSMNGMFYIISNLFRSS